MGFEPSLNAKFLRWFVEHSSQNKISAADIIAVATLTAISSYQTAQVGLVMHGVTQIAKFDPVKAAIDRKLAEHNIQIERKETFETVWSLMSSILFLTGSAQNLDAALNQRAYVLPPAFAMTCSALFTSMSVSSTAKLTAASLLEDKNAIKKCIDSISGTILSQSDKIVVLAGTFLLMSYIVSMYSSSPPSTQKVILGLVGSSNIILSGIFERGLKVQESKNEEYQGLMKKIQEKYGEDLFQQVGFTRGRFVEKNPSAAGLAEDINNICNILYIIGDKRVLKGLEALRDMDYLEKNALLSGLQTLPARRHRIPAEFRSDPPSSSAMVNNGWRRSAMTGLGAKRALIL